MPTRGASWGCKMCLLCADEPGNEGEILLQVTCSAAVCFFGLLAAFRRKLPSLQVRVASGPACLTGLLWSIGNFLSIYAVQVCLRPPTSHLCQIKALPRITLSLPLASL